MNRIRLLTACLAVALVCAGAALVAQGGEKYTVRLGWVPISGTERANVSGKGAMTAVLNGTRLTLNGTFEGLVTPATIAQLRRGVAKGARGPVIGELTITKATSGTITGTATLAPEQLEALKQGRLYVQVHSQKGVPPDGDNLWGWLLK